MIKHRRWTAAIVTLLLVGCTALGWGAEDNGVRIGAVEHGETALEFVGRIDQNGADFSFIGYVTRLKGLNEAALFAGGNAGARDETSALFTVVAETKMTSRSVLNNNVFAIDSTGKVRIFFQEVPVADFNNPPSFSSGKEIATFDLRYQSTINVLAPNQGLATGWGDLTQNSARRFSLGEKPFFFGQPRQKLRLSASGQGTLLNPQTPISVIFLTGNLAGAD